MRYFSQDEIEAISRRVYRAYVKTPGFSEMPEKVIPEQLAEIMGLVFDYRHLSRDRLTLGLTSYVDGDGVEVFDCPAEEFYCLDGKTILIEEDLQNDELKVGRCNFTKAHELSHHILHLLYPKTFGDGAPERRVIYYRDDAHTAKEQIQEERLVDRVASAVLMPENLIRSNLASHALPAEIDILNRIWRPVVYEKFTRMAADMGVSRQALCIRLKTLGLLHRDYLKNPYSLADIQKEEKENV